MCDKKLLAGTVAVHNLFHSASDIDKRFISSIICVHWQNGQQNWNDMMKKERKKYMSQKTEMNVKKWDHKSARARANFWEITSSLPYLGTRQI